MVKRPRRSFSDRPHAYRGVSHTPGGGASGGCNSRPLRTLYRGGDIVSVGYAIAHPRLNPVGILPPGSRPSDVHSDTATVVVDVDAMTCEACDAETKGEAFSPG